MATSYFSPFQSTASLFTRKKQAEQQYASPIDWSRYQSKPKAQTTTQRPTYQSTPRSTPTYQRPTLNTSMMSVPGQSSPALQRIQQARQQTQQQNPLPPSDPTGINPLIAKAREIAQRQAGFYADQADKQVGQLGEQQGIRQKYADERVSKLEALKDSAIGRINETIPLQEQATNEYKTQVEDQYGRQMKEQSRAQREEQQGIQDLFGSLNTIDSGAFITQGMKSRERLTSNQNATITARTNELNTADRDLKQYKLEAQGLIANEVQKFDDLLLQIAENMEVGSAEYNAAVQQVYAQAQEAIMGVESGLAERELAYEEKAQALKQEMMLKSQDGTGSLTEKQRSFMSAAQIAQQALSKLNTGGISSGFGQGVIGKLGETFGWNTSQQQSYRSDLAAARTAVRNALLGANMSPKEMESLMAAIPEFSDAPGIAKQKLESFISNMGIMANPGTQAASSQSGSSDAANKLLQAGFSEAEIQEYLGGF